MAGVTPNEPDDLSQEDIDAAFSAAGGDDPAEGAPLESDAAQAAEAPAEPSGDVVEPADAEPLVEESAAEAVVEEVLAGEAAKAMESPEGFSGLSQEDIDAALAGAAQAAPAKPAVTSPAKLDSAGRPFDEMAAMMEAAIAEERANAAAAAAFSSSGATAPASEAAGASPPPPPPAGAAPLELPSFGTRSLAGSEQGIELLNDVELNVKIELGRAEMLIEDVLRLGEGSVVELDKLAGDPVDVLVNERLVARGEVIVLNENLCVRVSEIVAGISDEGRN